MRKPLFSIFVLNLCLYGCGDDAKDKGKKDGIVYNPDVCRDPPVEPLAFKMFEGERDALLEKGRELVVAALPMRSDGFSIRIVGASHSSSGVNARHFDLKQE